MPNPFEYLAAASGTDIPAERFRQKRQNATRLEICSDLSDNDDLHWRLEAFHCFSMDTKLHTLRTTEIVRMSFFLIEPRHCGSLREMRHTYHHGLLYRFF